MKSHLDIRPYRKLNSKPVASFFREIFAEMGWSERESDYMDEPHRLFHLPNKGLLLIVKDNGEVVGTAGVIFLNNNEGLMKRFYIKKILRGSGIAGKLLEKLIENARSKGINKLILDVRNTNGRAIRFYEKNGFQMTKVEPLEGWPESFSPDSFNYYFKIISGKS